MSTVPPFQSLPVRCFSSRGYWHAFVCVCVCTPLSRDLGSTERNLIFRRTLRWRTRLTPWQRTAVWVANRSFIDRGWICEETQWDACWWWLDTLCARLGSARSSITDVFFFFFRLLIRRAKYSGQISTDTTRCVVQWLSLMWLDISIPKLFKPDAV